MDLSKSQIVEELSTRYPSDFVSCAIELVKGVGCDGVIDFRRGGAGEPFETEFPEPLLCYPDWKVGELKRLKSLSVKSSSEKEKQWYNSKVAELVGACAVVSINLPTEEYQETCRILQTIIDEVRSFVKSAV